MRCGRAALRDAGQEDVDARNELVAVVVLGVVGTGIAFALMGTLVGRVGSTRASFITYLIPVVALALGSPLRAETAVEGRRAAGIEGGVKGADAFRHAAEERLAAVAQLQR